MVYENGKPVLLLELHFSGNLEENLFRFLLSVISPKVNHQRYG